jgi:phosphoglycolate phosphatase-like HAD superfamily hydrolase
MLECLKKSDLKIGAFSSRYRNLIPSLEHVGVLSYFDAIVQGDEVTRHKPDPEGLYAVLEKLNTLPENASMSGDAVVDILAGQNAGVAMTIGITHGFGTLDALKKVNPTYIVSNLDEIPPLLFSNSSSATK